MAEIKLSPGAKKVGCKLMSSEYFGFTLNLTVLIGLLLDKDAAQISEDSAIPIDKVYRAQARWAALLEKIAYPDTLPEIVK